MKKTPFIPGIILFLSLFTPAVSAVKQVRVIVDRAAIYIEASRTSSRIEVVEKGTVLNLFQQKKVKDVWYYVSFSSRRYGSRISGFIHESSVEPVEDAAAAPPKVEEKKPTEKIQQAPAPEKPVPQALPEKPLPAPPKAEPKQEVKPKLEPVARYEEILVLTALPKAKSLKFPRREPARQELAWKPPLTAKPNEEPKAVVADIKPPPEKAVPKQEETPPQIKVEEAPPAQPEAKKEVPPVKPPHYAPLSRKPGFLAFGLGYGSSFGGAGACLQLNTGSGFALHAGAGLYPVSLIYSETEWVENKALFSVGLKYYLPLSSTSLYPYIDLQYGGLRIEAAQLVIGIWEYSYVYGQEQKSLYGPSLLAGTEIRLGRFGVNGALGLSYCLTKWDFLEKKLFLAFDAGLIVYF